MCAARARQGSPAFLPARPQSRKCSLRQQRSAGSCASVCADVAAAAQGRCWHLATRGSRIESAVAPEADHSLPERWPTDFLQRREIQDILAMLGTREKSGASVDHKSVRLDAWLIVWSRVLAMWRSGCSRSTETRPPSLSSPSD
jgi:hypothetical protein